MAVTSTELLRFILSLLGDPSKAEAFSSDPTGALASAGLGNVTCADIDAITPVIANAAQGAIAIAGIGSTPGEMVQHIVKNVAVSTFENNGVLQNIWTAGDVQQAFAGNGGLAMGGNLLTDAPIVTGDRNIVATDTAQASGRDTIQNQSDGNLALGGDQTIAQDNGVVAGGDAIAQGDKAGGNNNKAENTGNDNSVGGNQNSAENTGNDNSVGGNQNSAENTGNDNSVTSGDTTTNTVDDHSTTVGGNQNSASNTGNDNSVTSGDVVTDNSVTSGDVVTDNSVTSGDVVTDNSVSSGDVTVVSVEDSSVGGDYWENGSNVGGIGNDSSVTSGDVVTDNSVTSGDVTVVSVEDSSVGG